MKVWELVQDIVERQGQRQGRDHKGRVVATMSDKQTRFVLDLFDRDAIEAGHPVYNKAQAVRSNGPRGGLVNKVMTNDGRIWIVGQFPKRGGFISEDLVY